MVSKKLNKLPNLTIRKLIKSKYFNEYEVFSTILKKN